MFKAKKTLLAIVVVASTLQAPHVLAQSAEQESAVIPAPTTTANRFTSVASQLASSVSTTVVGGTESLIDNAMQLIGVRYRWGGNTPQSGLDCSGFVRYVFNDTFGFLLPRKSAQMSKVGLEIGKEELRPGDLVFFNTMRHAFSHVGIYVGDNKFIHAPSRGKSIRVDDMTKVYWEKRYNGARRVENSSGFDVMTEEQRQQLLLDFQERLDKTGRL
jgi:cell wall-associated NlpC family hydrolase